MSNYKTLPIAEFSIDDASNAISPFLKGRLALSVAEVAAILGISRSTTYALVKDGRLATRKVGRRTLITALSVNLLLQEGAQNA